MDTKCGEQIGESVGVKVRANVCMCLCDKNKYYAMILCEVSFHVD